MADAGVVAARPSQRYAEGVAREDWSDDPAQRAVLRELDRIHDALADAPRSGLLDRLFGRDGGKTTDGLYLWGGVGRGKTFLIDLFYAGLPLPESKPGSGVLRSEEHTSELQSLMRISYAVFCLKKKNNITQT